MVKEGKTVAEEQKAKYEIIYDMGTELYIAKVQLADLKEQDINARMEGIEADIYGGEE